MQLAFDQHLSRNGGSINAWQVQEHEYEQGQGYQHMDYAQRPGAHAQSRTWSPNQRPASAPTTEFSRSPSRFSHTQPRAPTCAPRSANINLSHTAPSSFSNNNTASSSSSGNTSRRVLAGDRYHRVRPQSCQLRPRPSSTTMSTPVAPAVVPVPALAMKAAPMPTMVEHSSQEDANYENENENEQGSNNSGTTTGGRSKQKRVLYVPLPASPQMHADASESARPPSARAVSPSSSWSSLSSTSPTSSSRRFQGHMHSPATPTPVRSHTLSLTPNQARSQGWAQVRRTHGRGGNNHGTSNSNSNSNSSGNGSGNGMVRLAGAAAVDSSEANSEGICCFGGNEDTVYRSPEGTYRRLGDVCSNEPHGMGGLVIAGNKKAMEDPAASRPFPCNSNLNVVAFY